MRKTMREIARLLKVERQTNAGAVPTLALNAVPGDKSLRYGGEITIGAATYQVATDAGRVRTFGNGDDFVKTVAKYLPTSSGAYAVTVATGILLVSPVPSDLVKDAQAKVLRYQAVKTAQQAVVADLDADLALMAGWATGNPLQVAKWGEVTAQKAAVVEDIAAVDALIAEYQAIASS